MRRLLATALMVALAMVVGVVEPAAADPAPGPSLAVTPHQGLADGQRVELRALGFFSLVSHDATFTPDAYQCPAGLFPALVIDPIDGLSADAATLADKCAHIGVFPVTGDYNNPESPTSLTVAAHSTVTTGGGATLLCGQIVDQCVLTAVGAARIADPVFAIASVPIGFASATPQPPLGAPTAVTAKAGNGKATVSWLPPASNGGSPVIGYTVTPFIGVAQPSQTVLSTATTRTITGLSNGTTYTFEVAAITAAGPGPRSTPSPPIVPAGPPGAPTNATAGATARRGEVTLTWTAPSSDGSNPISAYVVTPFVDSVAQPARRFGSPATTQTVKALTSGTTYTFKVAAVNGIATGQQSAASNVVAPK